jgi:hypothetical protein
MRTVLVSILRLALVAAPGAASESSFYDMRHLNDYAAQVSWRLVHDDGSHSRVCGNQGTAVFLGGNLFLTAAHLVDQDPLLDDCAQFGKADPVIAFGPARLRAQVVRAAPWSDAGGLVYRDGMDLALVAVDARMIPPELRAADARAVCEADLPAAAEVRVATEFGTGAARIMPRGNSDFARIDFRAKHGDSGGGVFDPRRGCLLGIISNGGAEGANYVPTGILRRFLDR